MDDGGVGPTDERDDDPVGDAPVAPTGSGGALPRWTPPGPEGPAGPLPIWTPPDPTPSSSLPPPPPPPAGAGPRPSIWAAPDEPARPAVPPTPRFGATTASPGAPRDLSRPPAVGTGAELPPPPAPGWSGPALPPPPPGWSASSTPSQPAPPAPLPPPPAGWSAAAPTSAGPSAVPPPAPAAGWAPASPAAGPSTPPPGWSPIGPRPGADDPSSWTMPSGPPTAGLPYGPSSAGGGGTGWTPPTWSNAPGATPGGGAPGAWGSPLSPYATGTAAPVVKRRSRVALAILSVTAVLAATTFAAVALTRPDGAGSPEEAVEGLFAALEQEDAIGVMESLPPSERDVLIEPTIATVGELQRLGMLDSFALEDVPGADIEIEGLTLESDELGTGVARVRVTGGTITGTVQPDDVPIGPRLRDLIEREEGEPLDIEADSDSDSMAGTEIVAIEEDGGWHVSLFYSIAESARGDAPLPTFGAGLTPIGSDSPEGAVREMAEAGIALDLERVIGYLPPDEMRVLYDYGPLFVDDAQQAADDAKEDGYTATLDRLDLHAEGDGDTRRVIVDALDVSFGEAEGEDGFALRYAWDGSCTTIESTSPEFDMFTSIEDLEDLGAPGNGGSGGGRTGGVIRDPFDPDSTGFSTMVATVCNDGTVTVTEDGREVEIDDEEREAMSTAALGQGGTFGQAITVVERDGRWYVSPTRTFFDAMLTALRGLEGTDIDEFFDNMGGFLGGPSSEFEPIDEYDPDDPGSYPQGTIPEPDPDDPYIICESIYDDVFDGTEIPTDEEIEAAEQAYEDCIVEHGGEPLPDYFGTPRLTGGTVLLPGEEQIKGFGSDGAPAFEGPACGFGDWTATTPGLTSTIEVAICDGSELVAVDGTTGAELWRRPTDELGWVIQGPNAVFESDGTTVTVLDLQTGAERWTRPTGGTHNATLDATTLYLDGEREVKALDLATGEQRWAVPMSVTMLDTVPGALMVRTTDGVVSRLDEATGAALWSTQWGGSEREHSVAVGATADTVVLQDLDGSDGTVAMDLATGELLWEDEDLMSYGEAHVGGSWLIALDDESYEYVAVAARTGTPQQVSFPPDAAGFDVEGNVIAILASDESGAPVITTFPIP